MERNEFSFRINSWKKLQIMETNNKTIALNVSFSLNNKKRNRASINFKMQFKVSATHA